MMKDADGMERWNIEWSIEGKTDTRKGTLYELHEQELANAKHDLRRLVRRGETLTIKVI